jgi:hypothetical protein
MPRCLVGSRNTQRQRQRRDGDCGLGRYHASSFGPTSSLRQTQGCFGDSRRYRLHQDAQRETLYVQVFPTSARLFDALITDYRIVITDYWLSRRRDR